MSSDFVLSITTKETPKQKNPIHLVMWEGTDSTHELNQRILELEKTIAKLLEEKQKGSSIFFPPTLHPTPRGIEVKSRSNSFTQDFETLDLFKTISKVNTSSLADGNEGDRSPIFKENTFHTEEEDADAEEEDADADADAEEDEMIAAMTKAINAVNLIDADAEEAEEAKEDKEQEQDKQQEADQQQDQAEEADQEEAEAEEFQEFEWKGQTYYRDSDNLVYQTDTDGDLIDTPIGIWKEATQKIVKYKIV